MSQSKSVLDKKDEIWYCRECSAYIGQTAPLNSSFGKTVILTLCENCFLKKIKMENVYYVNSDGSECNTR